MTLSSGPLPNKNLPVAGQPDTTPSAASADATVAAAVAAAAAATGSAPSGQWDGRVRPNTLTGAAAGSSFAAQDAQHQQSQAWMADPANAPYTTGADGKPLPTDPTTATGSAQAAARAAGVPYSNDAQVERAARALSGSADGLALGAAVKAAAAKPGDAAASRDIWARAASLSENSSINVWALLVAALRGNVQDMNDQLQYDQQRLETFSIIGKKMNEHGTYLANKQAELNRKMTNAPDDSKDKQQVVLDRNLVDFDTEMPSADGSVRARNLAKVGDKPPAAADMSYVGTNDKRGKEGEQLWKMPDGSVWGSFKDTEAEQKADIADQITQHNNDKASGDNQVNTTSLNQVVTRYQNEREMLQKQVDKYQNRYQSDFETKTQTTAALTAVLKNIYEMQSGVTRNLL